MRLENFGISSNSNIFIILLGIIIFAAYSYYIYKFTIPQVSNALKYFLISIRIAALVLLILVIFEPILNLKYYQTIEPVTFLFVDNSNSITAKDSSNRSNEVKEIISELKTSKVKLIPFHFSDKIKPFSVDTLDVLDYKGQSTNFYNVISEMEKSDLNISSAIIISDGIINSGNDPIFEAEKLSVPLFIVGIGDTTKYRDIKINDLLFNQYIYEKKTTEIEFVISQFGFDNRNTRATLYENEIPVSSKDIQLSPSGLNKFSFDYTPLKSGEIKLRINVSRLDGEDNLFNNSKSFFINSLKNKIKVGLIAGGPSADLASISNALETNKELEIKKIIQVSQNKFWKDLNFSIIDSSDVLFLVDFPSPSTQNNFFRYVSKALENKPFFYLFSQNVDITKLKEIENLLPFSITKPADGFSQAQANLSGTNMSSTFSGLTNRTEIWENLPPVLLSNSEFTPKPGSNVLVKSIVRNAPTPSPLLITRGIGSQRSISLIGGNIWRWELYSSEKFPGFFPNMISDFVKWLGISDKQKQFSVRTSKKLYAEGETVEFTAELYDQTFSPVESADVSVKITNGGKLLEINCTPVKPGMFQAVIETAQLGEYSFVGNAKFNSFDLKSEIGRFSVLKSGIEKENTRMDIDLLKQLAATTNGIFYFSKDITGLNEEIENAETSASKVKTVEKEIDFRVNEWIMILIICLFAVEWFMRKRSRMI